VVVYADKIKLISAYGRSEVPPCQNNTPWTCTEAVEVKHHVF